MNKIIIERKSTGQSNTELPLVAGAPMAYNPHFTDREGKMTAQLTRERNVRYAYCSNYKWSVTPKERYCATSAAAPRFLI
jgi:hypothetical protein